MKTKKLTVIVNDDRRPWPLIYDVEVECLPTDESKGIDSAHDHTDEILEQVADQRGQELEEDPGDTANHIELLFAFDGDLSPSMDWRD